MSPLTTSGVQSANDPNTPDTWLAIVSIHHETLDTPLRLVGNTEDVVSQGQTYTAVGLEIALPDQVDEELPTRQLRISDVSQTVVAAIRGLSHQTVDRPVVSGSLIRAEDPDWVELGPFEYELLDATGDLNSVSLELGLQNVMNRSFPSFKVVPQWFPSSF